jgi:hypothetical protein
MPDHLNTTQLEAIQRLISDPLREAVRAEMQAGHDRLTAAIEKVAEQLTAHVAETLRLEHLRQSRIDQLEQRVSQLEGFRAKVLIVYTALAVVLSLAWSLARDWFLALGRRR